MTKFYQSDLLSECHKINEMLPVRELIRGIWTATGYVCLCLFVLLCIYASLNTITIFLWGDPSLHGEPRLFHPPEIMVLHYVGMVSPILAQILLTVLFWSIGIFAWLGFRQITRKNSLDHPMRERIVTFIRSHPGSHFGSIMRENAINRGTLAHHLSQLTTLGLVREEPDGSLTRYFVPGSRFVEMELKILAHQDNPVRGRVLAMLEKNQFVSKTKLTRHLSITGPALWYHIQLLTRDGIITAEHGSGKIGRPVSYSLTKNACETLGNMKGDIRVPAGLPVQNAGTIPENELGIEKDNGLPA